MYIDIMASIVVNTQNPNREYYQQLQVFYKLIKDTQVVCRSDAQVLSDIESSIADVVSK